MGSPNGLAHHVSFGCGAQPAGKDLRTCQLAEITTLQTKPLIDNFVHIGYGTDAGPVALKKQLAIFFRALIDKEHGRKLTLSFDNFA